MGFQEYQQSLKWMAQNSNKNNLMTGKIFIKRDNDRYDCIILGDQNIVMPNLLPANPREEYNIGDEVFIGLPWGSLSILRILMRSNTSIPTEQVFTFRTKPAVPAVSTGNIYLACPTENKIKQYSLSGTAGTDIVTISDSQHNIVTDGTYFYCTSPWAYRGFKIKIDGTEEEEEIILQSRYYNAYGIAINPAGTHLYTAYDIWYERYGIASIDISTGEVEETELSELSGEVTDICSDENYIYVLCRKNGDYYSSIVQYNYSLEFVTEINTGSYYDLRLEKDENYFYAANSDGIDIFTIAGVFVRRISENGIRAVAVKGGKIYIVTEENSEGGAT
jgi:DNA-binding beta-propeller fold protein YncE